MTSIQRRAVLTTTLAAGEADIHVGRKDLHLVNPRVLPAGTADPTLPRIPQMLAKRQGTFVADVS